MFLFFAEDSLYENLLLLGQASDSAKKAPSAAQSKGSRKNPF